MKHSNPNHFVEEDEENLTKNTESITIISLSYSVSILISAIIFSTFTNNELQMNIIFFIALANLILTIFGALYILTKFSFRKI